MKNMHSMGLKLESGRLMILDQQLLPDEERWIEIDSIDDMIMAIRSLKVRGAPLIGVAAGLALAQYARKHHDLREIEREAVRLKESRPTAINLMSAIDRMLLTAKSGATFDVAKLIAMAETLFEEDVQLCNRIAEQGAKLIEHGDHILTHCNTGGLATVGSGTALAIIKKAHTDGKSIHVYVDETRPLLQGGRLTAWELQDAGIPYTVICDNTAGSLMRKGCIQRVFVGCDRIAINGDFANKVGTYPLAVLCKYHNIPFYPVAPWTSIDFACGSGVEIPIEERDPAEVRGVQGYFGKVRWTPRESLVHNPAFDITPVELITALILDTGIYSQEDIRQHSLTLLQRSC